MKIKRMQLYKHPRLLSRKEKIKRLKSFKPFILLFSVLFAILITLGSTFAWFIADDQVVNKLYGREDARLFRTILVDDFPDPDPDDIFIKIVGADNVGEKPGFIRLMVVPVIVAYDGTVLPAMMGKHVEMIDFNDQYWIDGGDGYFYYKFILGAGESTNPDKNLFERLKLDDNLGSKYDNATLKIEVKIEAIGISPADEYITSWWDGVIPDSGPLKEIYQALQNALNS